MGKALFFLMFFVAGALGNPIWLTPDEFKKIAAEIAPKVNLFRAVWSQGPKAEFFGGSSRDFLYWLKGQLLKDATSRNSVLQNIERLRKLPSIDVRDFIIGESDVDLIASRTLAMEPEHFGVKKIDLIDPRRLDLSTELGRSERDQGAIPVEKIRLAQDGLKTAEHFGDGAAEIWTGKITIQFPKNHELFKKTYFSKLGRNHESLLALRYLRLIAANYYYTFGKHFPDRDLLFGAIPSETKVHLRTVFERSARDPELGALLKKPHFAQKYNETVHKAFRTYVNPTATRLLYDEFGATKLIENFAPLTPINQYLFSQYRNEAAIKEHFREYEVKEASVLKPVKRYFSDGKLYHGASTEESFRNILLGGAKPSASDRAAGEGLYGVGIKDLNFAANWRNSTTDRVVVFPVASSARIIDIIDGDGKRLWEAYKRKNRSKTLDDFATYFGIDILKYPFEVDAYVVKNADVLERPNGLTRQILTFGALVEKAANVVTGPDLEEFKRLTALVSLTAEEKWHLVNLMPFRKTYQSRLDEAREHAAASGNIEELKRLIKESDYLLSDNFVTPSAVRQNLASFLALKFDERLWRQLVDEAHSEGDSETLKILSKSFVELSPTGEASERFRRHLDELAGREISDINNRIRLTPNDSLPADAIEASVRRQFSWIQFAAGKNNAEKLAKILRANPRRFSLWNSAVGLPAGMVRAFRREIMTDKNGGWSETFSAWAIAGGFSASTALLIANDIAHGQLSAPIPEFFLGMVAAGWSIYTSVAAPVVTFRTILSHIRDQKERGKGPKSLIQEWVACRVANQKLGLPY